MDQITAFKGEYQFLSNFAYSPFHAPFYLRSSAQYYFKTVEHYFQASKAYNFDDANKIRLASSARTAKTLGRSVELIDNWDAHRNPCMLQGLRYKFDQNKELADKLIATLPHPLVEGNTWNDRYWGMVQLNGANGPVWVGENWLGKMLMIVRTELLEQYGGSE